MMVVSHTTALSVLGAGLALRGPDGSMMTATDGLYEERTVVFRAFGVGLACTVGSVVLCVWLILRWEGALVCMSITAYTCYRIWTNYQRVNNRFAYDESETVDFRDIMEGPAAIQAVPTFYYNNRDGQYSQSGNNSRYSKKNSSGSFRQQQQRPPSASGTASQSSMSFGNTSQQRSFGERVRNRLTSFSSSVDGSNGSISSSYDDDEEAGNLSGGGGGTVEEIELQPLIVDGASNVTKRRGNARSQQQQQQQPSSSSLSKQAKAKKDDDAYIIQTV